MSSQQFSFNAMSHKRKKGKSLLKIPRNYTVIDLETTGCNPRFDNIIEISCIKYKNGAEFARFHSLIKPNTNSKVYVSPFITRLTGINNKMLASAPIFSEIADELYAFLQEEILVGHNVNFDINFLYDAFWRNNNTVLHNNFVDTLRLARLYLPHLSHHRLTDLDAYFHIGNSHHRAIDDCLTTNALLHHLHKLIISDENN